MNTRSFALVPTVNATTRSIGLFFASGVLAMASVACGGDTPAPATPANAAQQTTTTTTTTSSAPAQVQRDPNAAVNLSDEILAKCGIKTGQVTDPPKFNFDSAELSPAEKDIIGQVATCLTTGALKGRSIQLVGRADPRGEQEYNMELGENRANTVKKYMTSLGVDGGKVSLTSRGKLDANGTDEAGWAKDRRVDINLVPATS